MQFDDMAIQKKLEEDYKLSKTTPLDPYSGDYNSPNYVEVANKAITATVLKEPDAFKTPYKEDFDKAARDYWQRKTQTGLQKYNAGSFTSTFGNDTYTLDEFLSRIGRFIKESISNELLSHGQSPESIQENFKAVELSLKLLAKSVQSVDDKMQIEELSAYIHGFINTYISTTITKRINRETKSND